MRHLFNLFFITLFLVNFNLYSLTFKDGKQVNDDSNESSKNKKNKSSPAEVDEERYTSGGQWEVSVTDEGFIKYNEQKDLIVFDSNDVEEGRSFFDRKDQNDFYQIHAIYILAKDSKDKKYDVFIIAVSHKEFLKINPERFVNKDSVVFDVKGMFPEKPFLRL